MSNFQIVVGNRAPLTGSTISGAAAGTVDRVTVVGDGVTLPLSSIANGFTEKLEPIVVVGSPIDSTLGEWQIAKDVLAPGSPIGLDFSGEGLTLRQIATSSDVTSGSPAWRGIIGLSLGAAAGQDPANFISSGILRLTAEQWNAVIAPGSQGGFVGLQIGFPYYLSDVYPGKILNAGSASPVTPPVSAGNLVVRIGTPLDAQTMMLQIGSFLPVAVG